MAKVWALSVLAAGAVTLGSLETAEADHRPRGFGSYYYGRPYVYDFGPRPYYPGYHYGVPYGSRLGFGIYVHDDDDDDFYRRAPRFYRYDDDDDDYYRRVPRFYRHDDDDDD